MATKKAAKKKPAPKKPAGETAEAADHRGDSNVPAKHRIHLNNVTKRQANWAVQAKGIRERGVLPPLGHGTVRVDHARSYKLTMWSDSKKKAVEKAAPHTAAVYNGRQIVITYPH